MFSLQRESMEVPETAKNELIDEPENQNLKTPQINSKPILQNLLLSRQSVQRQPKSKSTPVELRPAQLCGIKRLALAL